MPNGGITFDQLRQAQLAGREFSERIVNEEARLARNAEADLRDMVGTESTRAKEAEDTLTGQITAETTRATGVETTLEQKIDDEIRRATNAEAIMSGGFTTDISELKDSVLDLRDGLAAEKSRSEGKDVDLQNAIDAEVERATAMESGITLQLTEEIARATGVENGLGARITDEMNRAKDAETDLGSRIDVLAQDTTNAIALTDNKITDMDNRFGDMFDENKENINKLFEDTAVIPDIQANLDMEVSRATGVENSLRNDIQTEAGRAGAEESAIRSALHEEVTRATSAEDVIIASIATEKQRATDSENAIKTKYNGEVARIDGTLVVMQRDITDNRQAATDAIAEVQGKLTTEVTRATGVETEIQEAIAAEVSRSTLADQTLDGKITEEVTRAKQAEEDLSEKVDIEKDRAVRAESDIITAYTVADTLEAETRANQDRLISDSVNTLSDRVTTEVSDLNVALTETNTNVTANTNDITTLKNTVYVGVKINNPGDTMPYVLSFMNAAGSVLKTIRVAHDPTDGSVNEKALVNKKYADAIGNITYDRAQASLESAITAANDALRVVSDLLSAETSRATSAEGVIDQKITDENLRAISAEITLREGIAALNTTTEGLRSDLTAETERALAKSVFLDEELDICTSVDFLDAAGEGLFIIEVENKRIEEEGTYLNNVLFTSNDGTVQATVDGTDLNHMKIDLSVPIATETIGKSVVGEDGLLMTDYNITERDNVSQPGNPPEYGVTWTLTKTMVNVNTGEQTITPIELNIFDASGVRNVQNELYDEIARSKHAEEALEQEVADLKTLVQSLVSRIEALEG